MLMQYCPINFVDLAKPSILALHYHGFIHNNKKNFSVLANTNTNGGPFFLDLIMCYEARGSSLRKVSFVTLLSNYMMVSF